MPEDPSRKHGCELVQLALHRSVKSFHVVPISLVNRVGFVRIAADEWTVAGRVDCGMLCEELNVHVELGLLLSHNGSKTTVVSS